MTQIRNLKELRWRSSMPSLPPSVLEAAKLKIDPEGSGRWRLPDAYRTFLSKRDGGRIVRAGFKSKGKTWVLEGFYAFADAANQAEKLRKAGKIEEGFLPVAFAAETERPLIFLELAQKGRVYIKTAPRARFDDAKAVYVVAKDFAKFLDMLGDPVLLDAGGGSAVSQASTSPWGVPTAPAPAREAKPKKKAAKKKAKAKPKKKVAKKKVAKKKAKAKPKKKAAKKKAKAKPKKKVAKKKAKAKPKKKVAKKKRR